MSEIIKKAEMFAKRKDFESAYDLLVQADSKVNSVATYALGTWYLFGRFVTKDYKKAVAYFTRASKKGFKDALFNLAICYEMGAGVEKDLPKAFYYYYKALQAGDLQAAYELGRLLYYGIGVEKNRELAEFFINLSQSNQTIKFLPQNRIQKPAKTTTHLAIS